MTEDSRRPSQEEIFNKPQLGSVFDSTILTPLKRNAYMRNATRPDQTFYQMVADGLEKHPKGVLAKMYGVGSRMLNRWIDEAKVAGEYDPELHEKQVSKRRSEFMKAYWDRDEMAEKRKEFGNRPRPKKVAKPKPPAWIRPEVVEQNEALREAIRAGLRKGLIPKLEAKRMMMLNPYSGPPIKGKHAQEICGGVSRQAISQTKQIVWRKLRENGFI